MKKFHSKIICQPIIETKESFYLLPRIFNRIFPKNLITNILTKGTKGYLYSKLINRIEKENLSKNEHLINTLKKFQFDLILEKSFSTGKKIVTPDFLLIDNINKEIMIIDYKHFLSPFSAADTSNRLKELQKGVKQLRKYLHFFSTYKDKELSNIKDYKHYGMLLFHNPMVMPVKLPKEGNIVFSDENTFYQYLPKVKSLTELNNTIKELPDLSVKIESCTYLSMELKVQNIKFKWPLFVVE
jgi:hypothetical protein